MKRLTLPSLKVLLSRRWQSFLIGFFFCGCLTTAGFFLQVPRYRASGTLNPKVIQSSILKPKNAPGPVDRFFSRLIFRTQFLTPEAEVLASDRLLQLLIEQLKIKDAQGNLTSPRNIRGRLEIVALSDDETVEVAFYDRNAKQASSVITALMNLYAETYGPQSIAESIDLNSVIQPLYQDTKRLLEESKQAIYQIQLGADRIPVTDAVKVRDQNLTLTTFGVNVEARLKRISEDLGALQQQFTLAQTLEKRSLLMDLIKLTQERRTLLEGLRDLLEQPQESTLIPSLILPIENKIFEVNRYLSLSQTAYNSFLENQQEPWQIKIQSAQSPIILRPATVSKMAFRPYLPWFVGIGGVLALGTGLACAWLRDQKDSSFLSISDFYESMPLPILGQLCRTPSLSTKRFTAFPGAVNVTPLKASVDDLLNNMYPLSQRRLPQVIVLTSTLRGEGKSMLTVHLALGLIKRGKKVLIIDADLYHPSQEEWWHPSHSTGLTDCLKATIQLGKALQRVQASLDILLAGSPAADPDILLNSPGMSLLMQDLRTRYDHILIDTPALQVSAHGYLIANNADASILVARLPYLNQGHIALAKELMGRSSNRFWGVILNDMPKRHHSRETQKVIRQTQWDAALRLQKKRTTGDLEISTFAAIDPASHQAPTLMTSKQAREQERYLYNLPLEELHKLVDSLWESWVNAMTVVLEEEEEVFQQGKVVRDLQTTIKQGNQYARLNTEVLLKEEREKYNLLAKTFVSQRPNLMKEQAVLHQYLEVLYARTDAEHVPSERKDLSDNFG